MAEGPARAFDVSGVGEGPAFAFDVGAVGDTGPVLEDPEYSLAPRDRLYARLMPVWGDQ